MSLEKFYYDNRTVKWFAYACMFWGLIGMLAGLWAALELVIPGLNMGFAPITFGRLRPVHTNAVIFAFVGNGIFMGVYYSLQRLCKARMFSDLLSKRRSSPEAHLLYSWAIQPVKNMPSWNGLLILPLPLSG